MSKTLAKIMKYLLDDTITIEETPSGFSIYEPNYLPEVKYIDLPFDIEQYCRDQDAREEKMIAALKFYANKNEWEECCGHTYLKTEDFQDDSCGRRAKEALESLNDK